MPSPDTFLLLVVGIFNRERLGHEAYTIIESDANGTYIVGIVGLHGARIRWGTEVRDGVHTQIFEVLDHVGAFVAKVTCVPERPGESQRFTRELRGTSTQDRTERLDAACTWVTEILQGLKGPQPFPFATPP